jgi:hypothetical protein
MKNNPYKDALQKITVPPELLAKTQAEMRKAEPTTETVETAETADIPQAEKTSETPKTAKAPENPTPRFILYGALASAAVMVLTVGLALTLRGPGNLSETPTPPSDELVLIEVLRSESGEGETVALADLAAKLRNKYALEEQYEYTTPLENLAQEQELVFKLGIDPGEVVSAGDLDATDYDTPNYNDFVKIFIDRDFTVQASYRMNYYPDTMELVISPGGAARNPDLFGYGYWGYANQYYMVLYYDTQTGEKLAKPLVTVFTIGAPLDAPRIEFIKDENGVPRIRWEPVSGAAEYLVYVTYNESDMAGFQINITKDLTLTEYVFDGDELTLIGTNITFMNVFFVSPEGREIYVIAVDENGEYSMASNPIKLESIARYLPNFIAAEYASSAVVNTLDEIVDPYTYIRMCDRSSVIYPITFDIETAEIVDVTERFEMEQTTVVLCVVARVDGTLLKAEYFIRTWNEETLAEDLQRLYERIENNKLSAAGAIVKPTLATWTANSETPSNVSSAHGRGNSQLRITPDIPEVFASSALSEYLAINMLGNMADIDIAAFNEGFDVDYLLDAFYEAYYQNPLILGVAGLETVPGTTFVRVRYEQDQAELLGKQKEITTEVARIIAEIIEPGMSDIEKQIAINDYLCATAEYDYAALDNAVANDMVSDPAFRDAFTPYGVLIKRVGVCASYASAFKLLANAAGLDCIVVTGYLNGYLPHAWNRVRIDGEWLTLDVTNNDNPGLFNILFNLPDSAAAPILLEDDLYILDSRLGEFTATSGANEYYRLMGQFYSKHEIARELAAGFTANGSVALRTDYDLGESELRMILLEMATMIKDRKTLEKLQEATVLNAWGVIYVGE